MPSSLFILQTTNKRSQTLRSARLRDPQRQTLHMSHGKEITQMEPSEPIGCCIEAYV